MIPFVNSRNAFIGFASSIVSDTVANFMRVIKTTKQALATRGDEQDLEYRRRRSSISSDQSKRATYAEAIAIILAADGWKGLFGRGLKTRIFANALQSVVFTVIWRGLSDRWSGKNDLRSEAAIAKIELDDEIMDESNEYNLQGDNSEETNA